jgi:hypothetical protein
MPLNPNTIKQGTGGFIVRILWQQLVAFSSESNNTRKGADVIFMHLFQRILSPTTDKLEPKHHRSLFELIPRYTTFLSLHTRQIPLC